MLAIIDYGVGNLFSLESSFKMLGVDAVTTSEPEIIKASDRLVLPGVGAFGDAVKKLRATGLCQLLCEQAKLGKPLLGICLGMQLLFEKSYEYGEHDGLGILHGTVMPMSGVIGKGLKIPQIGWNSLIFTEKTGRLLKYIKNGDYVYFVHSYYAAGCDDSLIAYTEYGANITAAVEAGNVFGCQFHPEKSGDVGLGILKAFCEIGAEK